MDTRVLSARLYSGSNESPGGGRWRYTAPIEPAAASRVVAAFNGGFKMPVAGGGYYTQGRWVVPPRRGAASLVIHADGTVGIGAWGSGARMGAGVVAVRQNLHLLVVDGRPASDAGVVADWGATVGGVSSTWRSGLGVTRNGALVYAAGPELDPLSLAQLLIRAGALRAMELDINPNWTVLATYSPATAHGPAAPSNGASLIEGMVQGPGTFFETWWARDFVTMSARTPTGP
jgi:Phosphodiester glycosidase